MLIYLQMIESEEERFKFAEIYETYRVLMFHVAKQILHNNEDAEDAVHYAFIAIMKNLRKISEVHCPKTKSYVVIIVERKAIDIIRSRKHEVPIEAIEELAKVELVIREDNGLARAMAKLPPRYRQVLLLRYDNGYSTREIAGILGMNHASVQKLLWRAKEELRRIMEKDGERT